MIIRTANKMSALITPLEYIYISTDSFEDKWESKTMKILQKCFKELPIKHFLNLVFTHKKSLRYIQTNKELRNACIDRINDCLIQLYTFYLSDAPSEIVEMFNSPEYISRVTYQVEVLRYILSTFKTHEYINELRELIHYKSKINVM